MAPVNLNPILEEVLGERPGRDVFPHLPYSHLPSPGGVWPGAVPYPVAGKPILGHILDQLVAVGIRRVVLVTGHMGEQIVEYVRVYFPGNPPQCTIWAEGLTWPNKAGW